MNCPRCGAIEVSPGAFLCESFEDSQGFHQSDDCYVSCQTQPFDFTFTKYGDGIATKWSRVWTIESHMTPVSGNDGKALMDYLYRIGYEPDPSLKGPPLIEALRALLNDVYDEHGRLVEEPCGMLFEFEGNWWAGFSGGMGYPARICFTTASHEKIQELLQR